MGTGPLSAAPSAPTSHVGGRGHYGKGGELAWGIVLRTGQERAQAELAHHSTLPAVSKQVGRAKAVPEPAQGPDRWDPGSRSKAKRGRNQLPGPRTACFLSLWQRWRVWDGLLWAGQLTTVSETCDRPDRAPPPPTGPGTGRGAENRA